MLSTLRRNNLVFAGILFAIAVLMYLIGLRWEAAAITVAGAVFEVWAWVTLARDRTAGQFPPSSSSSGVN